MSATAQVHTRDRLIDEAMRLFGERGYRGTSVAQIEKAAGLTPGSGGLYHHFRSKEQLLEAGIDRHANRLKALGDIRQIFEGLADLRSELTVLGRYVLTVLSEETILMRIVASEPRSSEGALPQRFTQMIDTSYQEMAAWIERRVPVIGRADADPDDGPGRAAGPAAAEHPHPHQ